MGEGVRLTAILLSTASDNLKSTSLTRQSFGRGVGFLDGCLGAGFGLGAAALGAGVGDGRVGRHGSAEGVGVVRG